MPTFPTRSSRIPGRTLRNVRRSLVIPLLRAWEGVLEFRRDPSAYKELATALANSGLDRESTIANEVAKCLEKEQPARENTSPAALAQAEQTKAKTFDSKNWGEALCHYERARTIVLANQLLDNWTGYRCGENGIGR